MSQDTPSQPLPAARDAWAPVERDASLSAAVRPSGPARQPAGEDLDLRMGWDRFEKLLLAICRDVLGVRGVRFRRYGTQGQAQHGIDLAGRAPDGSHVVVQCKEYQVLTPAELRAAVELFATGKRPFDARTFIVATSAATQSTQLADTLDALRDEHPGLDLDLWGSEQLNEHLRGLANVVARFWSPETAERFSTDAPRPGVPAPALDRQQQAEQILIGPLNAEDVRPMLRQAEAVRDEDPGRSADLFGQVAQRLVDANFHGHASVLRRRQLDALIAAGMSEHALALAGELIVTALLRGRREEARALEHLINNPVDGAAVGDAASPGQRRQVQLLAAAVRDTTRPTGTPEALLAALPTVEGAEGVEEPAYHPALVLLLAEDLFATSPEHLPGIDALITAAIERLAEEGPAGELRLRLQLVRAEYDDGARANLRRQARQHRVDAKSVAWISAREARRCALQGHIEQASEAWRDAIEKGIHVGMSEEAADWLYALRSLNLSYGPITEDLDDEHRLAQAVRSTGSQRLLDRSREPREAAMSAVVAKRPIEAVLSSRRWLIDACITGAWADENEAAEMLADLYADNEEPELAALLYQRVGATKKAVALAGQVGDRLLPTTSWQEQPWWVVQTQAAQVCAQSDLLDDDGASHLMQELLRLARLGRAGELTDSPMSALSLQVQRGACEFAGRGSEQQARALFELLAPDVPRPAHRYRYTDEQHVGACLAVAAAHPNLTFEAVSRLIDLAEQDVQSAQNALAGHQVEQLLAAYTDDSAAASTRHGHLSEEHKQALRARLVTMVEQGRFRAEVALAAIAPEHPLVHQQALAAHEAILSRPDPSPNSVGYGSRVVDQSYLVRLLPAPQALACLDKLLAVAGERREAAANRRDALIGCTNLVRPQPSQVRTRTFEAARPFALGERDGSAWDDTTGTPHPLSTFKISMGSASLRGAGLRLAHAAAEHPAQLTWVRERAVQMLHSQDPSEVAPAAGVLNTLPAHLTDVLDLEALATSTHPLVRQLAALLALRNPHRHANVLTRLVNDHDHRVRRALAEGTTDADDRTRALLSSTREALARDLRHSVRHSLGQRTPDLSAIGPAAHTAR
ncbi:hypothetical protein [Kineococcus sp. SYSU DK005]|uniref:hypothetical protein n=1 Tax=Kineococcus sp. SYSU DK005 TaxID=3383126 RepID=UPI003D7CBE25